MSEEQEVPAYLKRASPERIGLVKTPKALKVQVKTLLKLMEQRVLTQQMRQVLVGQIDSGKLTQYKASEWIAFLHKQPWAVDRSGGKDR